MVVTRALMALAFAWAVLLGRVEAAETQWIEVAGHAAISGQSDQDSARRRALADAIFNAALAGGVDVRGHTAVHNSVVTSDLAIVRVLGRVLDHQIIAQSQANGLWTVTIRARVGMGGDPYCQSPRRLMVSAYAPVIEVSPHAPAWAGELAQQVAADLILQLDRHPSTDIVRITDRTLPAASLRSEALDYTTITQGSVRLQPGEMGFVPVLRLGSTGNLAGPGVVLEAELQLHSPDGGVYRQVFSREASLGKPRLAGRLGELTRRDRQAMAKALTSGLKETFTRLLDTKACSPLTATLAANGKTLHVPIGRNHGLSRAALAFTSDRDHSTELLEVVDLGATSATLRPLDPGVPVSSLSGRPVRFVDAAW